MEAEDYMGYVRGLAARRNARTWRVDCAWLEAQGCGGASGAAGHAAVRVWRSCGYACGPCMQCQHLPSK